MKNFSKKFYKTLFIDYDSPSVERYKEFIQKELKCKADVIDQRIDLVKWLNTHHYHLIVFSVAASGVRVLKKIKKTAPLTPVIVISKKPRVEDAVAAIRFGAEDYLQKPVSSRTFRGVVRRGLGERSLNTEFESLVYFDEATGLHNIRYFQHFLEAQISCSVHMNQPFAILFIDIDNFKSVNTLFGHLVGNQVLKEFGDHLKVWCGDGSSAFRYGGDEFIVVITNSTSEAAQSVAEKIRKSVEKKKFLLKKKLKVHLTVSVGVALFPDDARTKSEIIEAADRAMFHAKRESRNCVTIFGSRLFKSLRKG